MLVPGVGIGCQLGEVCTREIAFVGPVIVTNHMSNDCYSIDFNDRKFALFVL